MIKEYPPYQECLDLKRLGYDRDAIYHYKISPATGLHTNIATFEIRKPFGENFNAVSHRVSAPLYQQVFRWFREVQNLHVEVKVRDYVDKPSYFWSIFGKHEEYSLIRCLSNSGEGDSELYETYEEAELAVLRSLIQIVAKRSDI